MTRFVPCILLLAGLAAAALSAEENEKAYKPPTAEVTNSLGMRLAKIPAGKFTMGSLATEVGRYDDEEAHLVDISQPFYLAVFEVTQGEYQKVTGGNPAWFSAFGAGRPRVKGLDTSRFPVEKVSWEDAIAFCKKLSALPAEKKAGRVYRLPTEAEWEWACRGAGTGATAGPFHFGPSLSAKEANFNGNFPYGRGAKGPNLRRTAKVGSYPPSAFGVHDTHGNVWEWCADWYDKAYYKVSPKKDPPGPAAGDWRVVRGGSWYGAAALCRASHRMWASPTERSNLIGFRVACTVKGK